MKMNLLQQIPWINLQETLEEESFQAALAYARPTHVLILDRGHDAIAVNLDATGYDEPTYAIYMVVVSGGPFGRAS